MAMSKCRFAFLLLLVIVVLAGAVAIVVWQMTPKPDDDDNNKADSSVNDVRNNDQRYSVQGPGVARTEAKCKQIFASRTPRIEFAAKLGESKLAIRESVMRRSGTTVTRNAYWLTGSPDNDAISLKAIELQACEGKVPVIVIKMRPTTGLQIHHGIKNWDFYKPPSPFETWAQYDKKLNVYLKRLASIPSLVILEPDLLMFTYDFSNQQYRWLNSKYEGEFLKRAQRVISRMKKAWVYVDAGNAAYLTKLSNVEHMATTLLRLSGLRGFAINTFHFVNRTYNEAIARRLHCRTGLHYLVDTSRNGGTFSKQSIAKMERCLFDPPSVQKGQQPGWSWGSKRTVRQPRMKRWVQQYNRSPLNDHQNQPALQRPVEHNPYGNSPTSGGQQRATGSRNGGANTNQNSHRISSASNAQQRGNVPVIRSESEASNLVRAVKRGLGTCMASPTFMTAHDASVWLKTPGESDGRLYQYGSFHNCLMGHSVPCDDNCQLIQQSGSGSRSSTCNCDVTQQNSEVQLSNNFFSFPLTRR